MESSHVVVKLDMDFGLKAGKSGGARCINVQWNKLRAGACYVKYEVVLRNASGGYEYSASGYNIGQMSICNFAKFKNVTDVQLTVTFKATSINVTASVADTPISTPPGMTPLRSFHSTHYFIYKLVQVKDCLKCHI